MKAICLVALASSFVLTACPTPPPKGPGGGTNDGTTGTNNGTSNNNGTNNGTTKGGGYVDPNDYDQSCTWDSDCTLVWGGDVCGCGMICPGSIATSAEQQFQDDVSAVDCSNAEPKACPGAACQEQIAICSSGSCNTTPKVSITASQFDQSCDVDADCMLISTGQVCSTCNCARAAINVSDAQAYQQAVGDVDCNPGPEACDCAPPDEAWCNDSTCDVRFGM